MNITSIRTWIGTGFILLFVINIFLVLIGVIANSPWFITAGILLSVCQLGLHDHFSRKHTTLPNYPFAAKLRHIFSFLPSRVLSFLIPERKPDYLNKDEKEIISKRSRDIDAGLIPNSLTYPFHAGYECVMVSQHPVHITKRELFVEIGTGYSKFPYRLNVLSIGSLNYEAVPDHSILALSRAAKLQSCAVCTGVLGINAGLLRGGSDLVWRISRFDKECRDKDGTFNETHFELTSRRHYVKMIEIKVSPDDLPLAGKEITFHHMIFFLDKLKQLSGGKPVGICINNPSDSILNCICKTMFITGIYLDFITIENGPSAYIASRQLLRNDSLDEFCHSISGTRRAIGSYALPTKIIASGDIVTEYDILRAIALGADACYSTGAFQSALNGGSAFLKDTVDRKQTAVSNFHRNTVESTVQLMEACAYQTLQDVKAQDFYHRTTQFDLKSLDEIYCGHYGKTPRSFITNLN